MQRKEKNVQFLAIQIYVTAGNSSLLLSSCNPVLPIYKYLREGFPGGSDGKASACNAGDPGSVPGRGKSPGEGNVHTLQYPCQENPMDRGAWQATVYDVTKSQT